MSLCLIRPSHDNSPSFSHKPHVNNHSTSPPPYIRMTYTYIGPFHTTPPQKRNASHTSILGRAELALLRHLPQQVLHVRWQPPHRLVRHVLPRDDVHGRQLHVGVALEEAVLEVHVAEVTRVGPRVSREEAAVVGVAWVREKEGRGGGGVR